MFGKKEEEKVYIPVAQQSEEDTGMMFKKITNGFLSIILLFQKQIFWQWNTSTFYIL